ncbi:MAG TPA: BTAD domain-containing putative transcriptional regulator [Longimicrobium sp.]|nr:BTAD domain-containing putative transcriptional regulator [Longimicrobium sp.]
MLYLRVLGAVALDREGDPGPRALVAQPKRLALLVYLALARPRGPQRRDQLLARFWPGSGDERGRGALRLALHALRKALGPHVLAGSGGQEVGLAPGALWCDALEFDRAVDEGRDADALALYAGELLPGFHLSGEDEWERWLQDERARLARRALEAAGRLADAADAADDLEGALAWARRATDLDPHDEAAVRRLMVLLDAVDDGAAATRAYHDFARRLRADTGDEPLAPTRDLARAIAERASVAAPVHRAVSAPSLPPPLPPTGEGSDAIPADPGDDAAGAGSAAGPAAGTIRGAADSGVALDVIEASPSSLLDPASSVSKRKPRGRWTGRRAWLAAAGVALVAGGLAWVGVRGVLERRAEAAFPLSRMAVLPFRVRGAPQTAYLGEGLVDLLSTRLDGAGPIHTVDPVALLGYARRQGLEPGDLADGVAAARHFGAGSLVVGDVVEAGGRLQVTASLYDVRGRLRATARAASADERDVFGLVDRVALALLAGSPAAPGQRLTQTAALTTTSLPALRSYLTGEQWFRQGKVALAVEAFAEAAGQDSTFALALYRLSTAMDWSGRTVGARTPGEVVAQALRFRGRLAPHDRLLLDARDAYWNGSARQAERLYRAALADDPADVEVWHELGEVLFHRGVWLGIPLTRARAPFERVLALDPANESARIHLARIAAVEGRAGERDSLIHDVVGQQPAHARALELLALGAFGSGDARRVAGVTERMRGLDYDAVWLNAWRAADFTGNPAAGEAGAALLLEPSRSARSHAVGHTLAAHMAAARGQWRRAASELRAAAALEPAYAAQVRASLALLPQQPLTPAALAAIRAALDTTPVPAPDTIGDPVSNARRYCPSLCRVYLKGALAARAGDSVAARHALGALETARAASPHEAELVRYQAHVLRARLEHDPARALALLEEGWPGRTLPQFSSFEPYGHTPERMLRASLLRATGNAAAALEWYNTVDEDLGAGLAWLAPAHLARAELCEQLGRRGEAADHYARFVALWNGADPELQPLVARARERLAALRR